MILINNLFQKIKIRKIILIYICAIDFCNYSNTFSKIINYIKNINYKKIAHLYILNIGINIGIGFCFFIEYKSFIKLPSTMYIIFGITLAPIVEELIFRSVILNRLKIRFGIILAIFVSEILFGIAHFDINILDRLIFRLLYAILFFQ